ncbi:MAG TPA: ABC transporter permease [Cyclobacteriaceae bacterium]|nr:ABC transporter permease [Cyclobacteriaceae bacterium]
MFFRPPKLARRFLIRFLRDDLAEEVQGDLEEKFYSKLNKKSLLRAKINYWFQVMNYLRPFAIRNLGSTYSNIIFMDMLRHNITISFRNFIRHKMTFGINMIGLSTGLACALLIYLWVDHELSIDKFHEKGDRLYQVLERRKMNEGVGITPETSGPMADLIKEAMPEVEYSAAIGPVWWPGYDNFSVSVGQESVRAAGQYAGKDYFNIFSFELLAGSRDRVLTDKNSIVLSEELVLKLFKSIEDAIGKVVMINQEQEFIISGVMKNIPSQSSTQFDLVMPFETLKDLTPWVTSWGSAGPIVYVTLKEGTDVEYFNEKFAAYIKDRFGAETERTALLTKFSDIYLFGIPGSETHRIRYVRLFSIIAVFILLIACINFMNLSTARASRRLKEVGVKKVMGAGRKSLIFQFMGESVMTSMLSLVAAILIVLLFLPAFSQITGKQLSLQFDRELLIYVFLVTIITGIIAGSYPALYLSGFRPLRILKSSVSSSPGEVWVRKGLVVFQFSISILLIVCVLVVYKQIEFVQNKNLGYNKNNVLWIGVEGKVKEKADVFLAELRKLPGVENAAATSHRMVGHNWSITGVEWEGRDPEDRTGFQIIGVDYGFIEMMKFEFMKGRPFSSEFGADGDKIIFNEAAIAAMGMNDPMGKSVNFLNSKKEIIGVVKDFHFKSMHEKIEPLAFILISSGLNKIMVRVETGREKEALANIGRFYESFNPGFTFDYQFLDDNYQNLYLAEQRVSILSRYFAGIAILISCLGLFGLAAFTAERRQKEIGIRKILGSGVFAIVRLLSTDFTKIVIVAIIIALPVSYFMVKAWLIEFAYRIDLEWWYFAGAGIAALLIAWFTVGLQTYKASTINPTECLKVE